MEYSNFPDLVIPDDLWEKINPTEHEGAGILCPTCIACRLDYLGLWYKDGLFRLKRSRAIKRNRGIEMIDPKELFENIMSGKLYQIIIGDTKFIKRNCRSWVGCDDCGRDIKFNENNVYFQKGKSGKRFCVDCFGEMVRQSIFDGKPITIDLK